MGKRLSTTTANKNAGPVIQDLMDALTLPHSTGFGDPIEIYNLIGELARARESLQPIAAWWANVFDNPEPSE